MRSTWLGCGEIARQWVIAAAAVAMALSTASAAMAVSPDEAIALLKEGNARFIAGTASHPSVALARVVETAGGQAPFAAVLTCSDSRVAPEIVFNRDIGDLFVVRDAGNVTDPVVVGSIEYSVGHLKTPLVVVMGHTHCGAVGTAVAGGAAKGSIPKILRRIEPSVKATKRKHPDLTGERLTDEVARANVQHSIDGLLKNSPELHEAVEKGSVKVVGALYNVSDGKVEWLPSVPAKEPAKQAKPAAEHQ